MAELLIWMHVGSWGSEHCLNLLTTCGARSDKNNVLYIIFSLSRFHDDVSLRWLSLISFQLLRLWHSLGNAASDFVLGLGFSFPRDLFENGCQFFCFSVWDSFGKKEVSRVRCVSSNSAKHNLHHLCCNIAIQWVNTFSYLARGVTVQNGQSPLFRLQWVTKPPLRSL